MATALKNLSDYKLQGISEPQNIRVGIVTAQWNEDITNALAQGCKETLLSFGVSEEHILERTVPGSFELPLAAKWLCEETSVNAVVCIGCLIKGDTPHFEYISEAVSRGIMDLNLQHGIPFVFGVITTLSLEQAQERAGGKHGNKGVEAAITALQMLEIKRSLVS